MKKTHKFLVKMTIIKDKNQKAEKKMIEKCLI